MASENQMQPKDAIILRNKDEINIPLLLNEIPTATEFKDAIGSLSPEQQRFAKAFRTMQLESSVLGVCVIQIKPQLEKLLRLPEGALTKEMKLTQDLTELFVTYQVPSDLVAYDGEVDCDGNRNESVKDKVANVKEHVKSVLAVIADQKKEQLEGQAMATEMAAERRRERRHAEHASINKKACKAKPRLMGSAPAPAMQARYCAMSYGAAPGALLSEVSAVANTKSMITQSNKVTLDELQHTMEAIGSIGKEADMGPMNADVFIAEDSGANTAHESTGLFPNTNNVKSNDDVDHSHADQRDVIDFTMMPKLLDGAIEIYDKDGALRSTTVEISKTNWTRNRQENLLTKSEILSLTASDIAAEKSRAFDLLDALSRSGSLPIYFSELHVLVCATHCFEKNVMETVIQDNINPIEKLEMSTLLIASTILDTPAQNLIRKKEDRKRLTSSFPRLLS